LLDAGSEVSMPRLICVALVLALFGPGCGAVPQPMSRHPTTNPDYDVELLFQHDGCDIYRFNDFHPVYYAHCHDGSATTDQPLGCGRGCVREEVTVTASGGAASLAPP
jgi:hypothetical protein